MSILSKTQFMPAGQLAGMMSSDYDVPVGQLRGAMNQRWQDALNGKDEAHPSEEIHGGPDNYIEHLKTDIAKNGIKHPIRIKNGKVFDGHHRAIAALELGMTSIPFKSFKPITR